MARAVAWVKAKTWILVRARARAMARVKSRSRAKVGASGRVRCMARAIGMELGEG